MDTPTMILSDQYWKSMELAKATVEAYRAENRALRRRVAQAEAGAAALSDALTTGNGVHHV